ncbi:MAG TPA: histidinol-phosphate transaminase [Candidatus Acidoferrales bacterium]|nr:histidinol-phosphate transaminase [Candidatus Acidoferrales bacterium]
MKNKIEPRRAIAGFRKRPAMLEGRGSKLRLDMNESSVGCSPRVRAALRGLRSEDLAIYPERGTAAARFAPFFGVHPSEMVITAGIDEALRLIADVFLERGRSVLLLEPTFPMYRFFAEQREARIHALRCGEDMQFPLDDVLRALRQNPTVFFLPNPNNPTGALLSKQALSWILDGAKRTLVVVDEAYFEFSGVTVLPWIRQRRNLAVTRTFSKAAGLAGLRVGCLFAHRELAAIFRSGQDPFPVGVAQLAAAEAALRDAKFTRRAAAEIIRGRKILETGLTRLGVRFFPSAANFVLADFGKRGTEIIAALATKGILIRDQSAAIGRSGFVRITAGSPAQMRFFLRVLRQSCSDRVKVQVGDAIEA